MSTLYRNFFITVILLCLFGFNVEAQILMDRRDSASGQVIEIHRGPSVAPSPAGGTQSPPTERSNNNPLPEEKPVFIDFGGEEEDEGDMLVDLVQSAIIAFNEGSVAEKNSAAANLADAILTNATGKELLAPQVDNLMKMILSAFAEGTDEEKTEASVLLARGVEGEQVQIDPLLSAKVEQAFRQAFESYQRGTLAEERQSASQISNIIQEIFAPERLNVAIGKKNLVSDKEEVAPTVLPATGEEQSQEKPGVVISPAFRYANAGFRALKNQQWDKAIQYYQQAAYFDSKFEVMIQRTIAVRDNVVKFGIETVKNWKMDPRLWGVDPSREITYGQYFGW